jgi:hypothetical protein
VGVVVFGGVDGGVATVFHGVVCAQPMGELRRSRVGPRARGARSPSPGEEMQNKQTSSGEKGDRRMK